MGQVESTLGLWSVLLDFLVDLGLEPGVTCLSRSVPKKPLPSASLFLTVSTLLSSNLFEISLAYSFWLKFS